MKGKKLKLIKGILNGGILEELLEATLADSDTNNLKLVVTNYSTVDRDGQLEFFYCAK